LSSMVIMTVACSDIKSADVKTSGMYLHYHVVSDGEGLGTDATATLTAGGATSTTYVDLDESEQLVVTTGEEVKELEKQSLVVVHTYTASFDETTPGAEFELAYDRVDSGSAPSSIAVLPEDFVLTEPTAETVISRSEMASENLTIAWDNQSTEPLEIEVSGDCIQTYFGAEETDSGSHIIPISHFDENDYDDMAACTATIVVQRMLAGTVDSAFNGGTVYGAQRRTLDIRIDP
jgi:hypothetical protein